MIVSQNSEKDSKGAAGADRGAEAGLGTAHVWAAMSHEIRTPLSGVHGMLEILSSTTLTDKQRRIIATVEESSAALMRIVDDVLDLARLEETSVEFELRSTNVADLVEDCAEFLANQADAKGLTLTCETDIQAPDVTCDPLRLRQVLLNLTSNAIKFTDTGRVALSVTLNELSGDRANIRFAVEDSGIGIPDDLKAFPFQPFSRIKDSGTRGEGGVGLGLSICRSLVESMGGVIHAESMLGQGARFTVDIPFDVVARGNERDMRGQLGEEELAVIAVSSEEPAIQIAVRYLRDAGATLTLVDGLGCSPSALMGQIEVIG